MSAREEEIRKQSPSAGGGGAAGGGRAVPVAPRKRNRRVVVCGGVRGVFARRDDGRWGLVNGAELAVLEGLGGPSEPISRLQGMGAALEAGVAGPGDLAELGRCLRSVAESEEVFGARVPPHLVAAVTVACAWWNSCEAWEWLGWAVSARLEGNLSAEAGVGPGWLSWDINAGWPTRRAWWHETSWLEGLGEEFWDRLARHPSDFVRLSAEASDPHATPARLTELAKSPLREVADLVASHPHAPAKTLKDLCRSHGNYWLVLRVAQNTSADPAVLRWLTKGKHHGNEHRKELRLKWFLAVNRSTPGDALERLSRCEDTSVLSWIASHPNAGRRTLERLAGHTRWVVRRPIGWNPSSPDRLIKQLAADKHRRVRAAVAERRGLNEAPAGQNWPQTAAWKCEPPRRANPELCERLIRRLAQDPHPRVRASIARWADLPEDVLAALAEDPDPSVREALGENPSTSPEIVRLAEDPDLRVRRAVCHRPEVPEHAIRLFARSEDVWLRWGAAANPSTPPDVLATLVDDPDSGVKDIAARNPNIDVAVLERLAAHPRQVRPPLGDREPVGVRPAARTARPRRLRGRLLNREIHARRAICPPRRGTTGGCRMTRPIGQPPTAAEPRHERQPNKERNRK